MTNQTLFTNLDLATMTGHAKDPLGIIRNAAIMVKDGIVAWAGPVTDAPDGPNTVDLGGIFVLPGLIDCHTHLVYAGNRAHEFEQRLQGKSYADIAKAGGGILSTVAATRAASVDHLYTQSLARLQALAKDGVTTIEIKSGYGLDLETEAKMLQVARHLGQKNNLRVITTFLGAHAVPPEYKDKPDDYISSVCGMMSKLVEQRLVDQVDAFCENIGFSATQVEKVFTTAKTLGLPVKLHAEQLSDQKGAALAARYGALSADHLEYVDEGAVKEMARTNMTAVLLPAAFYYLRETKTPPVDLFRKHRVRMAIATDHNPGTAPALSLSLMLNMACTLFRLTPEEALLGVTCHAASALGLVKICGRIAVGQTADFSLWAIDHPRDLCANIGGDFCRGTVRNGIVYRP